MNLWLSIGAPKDRVIPVPGLKENFWAMGETGPCGPCSELHYDMGPFASDEGHADCKFPCDCDRYVEIWNLVFMQFNRDASGAVMPLPKPSIDTGAGLERLASVMLNLEDPFKLSNYDTDLFRPLMDEAAKLTGLDIGDGDETISLRIIADHSRAATFLISDGVIPSNEGRGYVLRKIINRALLNTGPPETAHTECSSCDGRRRFIANAKCVSGTSGRTIQRIASVLESGTSRYKRTMKVSLRKLSEAISDSFREEEQRREKQQLSQPSRGITIPSVTLSGDVAFKMYDTFGLQRDVIDEVSRIRDVTVDWPGFDKAMKEQRERGKASWKGGHKDVANPVYTKLAETYRTEPDFYYGAHTKDCRIEAIVTKDGAVNELPPGAEGEIVLDRTIFYSESGGQVSDIGTLWNNEHTMHLADVRGAYYPVSGVIAHRIAAKEKLVVGDRVSGIADAARREHIKRNHTATHLMHAALRNILGAHVKQAGSLVEPGRLRFDFSHFAAIDAAELRDIEQQVNDEILLNSEIETNITNIDDALASGALAFFGDRYPEQNVRVVTIPDHSAPRGFYSKELCGGTHVRRSGDIGVFKIAMEQSAAAGVRRIEAITGAAALADYQRARQLLDELAARLGVGEENLAAAVERAEQTQRQLEKQLDSMKRKGALSKLDDLIAGARTIKGIKVISAEIENVDREGMRQLVDSLRQKMGSGVVVLGTAEDGKVALLAGVTKDLIPKLHAGKIIQATAKQVGGSGGGRPDLAEAGGKDTSNLKTALDQVYPLIEQML